MWVDLEYDCKTGERPLIYDIFHIFMVMEFVTKREWSVSSL